MPNLDWFYLGSESSLIAGVPLEVGPAAEGFQRVLELAVDSISSPHLTVHRDLLTAECNEIAELFAVIVEEDGHSLSLAAFVRALVLETAKRQPHGSESGASA